MIVLVAGSTTTATELARHLWMRGFDAAEAESPGIGVVLEALEIADAVVIDVDDPDLAAMQIIERLKTSDPRLPVVAVGGDDRAAASYLAGADLIVNADVDPTDLAGELHRLRPPVAVGG